MPNVTGGARDTFGGSARAGGNTSGGRSSNARGPDMGALSNIGAGNNKYGPTAATVEQATTSYGAPIHTDQYGTQWAKNPQKWAALSDRVETYNKAARKWNAGAGPSIANAINGYAPMGFSMQAPDFARPATYTGGDYHLGVNPVGLAIGLGSMAAGAPPVPGLGTLASKAYNALGFHDLVLTGPDVPAGWTGPGMPGSNTAPDSPSATQAASHSFSNTGGNPMAAFPSNPVVTTPGGAPMGAQPTPPSPVPSAFPMAPKIPNHSLPQGYESLFPNSLSDADKALLYGQALRSA